jgi:hypothetical protein
MNIIDLGKNNLKIGNQIITGFIREEKCDKCSNFLVYNDIFDADFCPDCNEWKDIRCPDTNCDTCKSRPSKPVNTSEFTFSKNITYKNIPDIIDEIFPEFVKSNYYDANMKELQYIHLGNLTLLAFENLDTGKDLDLAIRLMKLTDYIINNYGGEIENLFGIEVFETITAYKKGAQLAKEYLTDKALHNFHATVPWYHTDIFLAEYRKLFPSPPNVKF